jgi:hypothetical protein
MAYTPELSQRHSGTLRRLAWALDKPMTRCLDSIFDWIGQEVDARKVCPSCRDKRFCPECVFHKDS